MLPLLFAVAEEDAFDFGSLMTETNTCPFSSKGELQRVGPSVASVIGTVTASLKTFLFDYWAL